MAHSININLAHKLKKVGPSAVNYRIMSYLHIAFIVMDDLEFETTAKQTFNIKKYSIIVVFIFVSPRSSCRRVFDRRVGNDIFLRGVTILVQTGITYLLGTLDVVPVTLSNSRTRGCKNRSFFFTPLITFIRHSCIGIKNMVGFILKLLQNSRVINLNAEISRQKRRKGQ